ncbi:phosphatidylinositol glycan anchor biosynthesis class O [Nomia melanderi]|uniref:phosphatidylinositol glycan anchor biosynthesis class O n=1 Tax=Nomia melanderi TaxID=2448451 RepID=UPI0013045AE6|nr:GPI ethanolamine phosphate transferase 3 [Nomia melanderi]XP_031826580.1 GPI ethanolamine phosphate transferase 3 [Nomia melanderi]
MSKLWNYLIFQGWISYLMAAGLLVFTSGFLLNRVSRPERAECKYCTDPGGCNVKNLLQDPVAAASTCLERKARVVLLVVDALRYDFVHWYNDNSSTPTYYRNKLPIIHKLLQTEPKKSRLYKFIADPPTTTMQRLKGFTTGSLPTFIDIGSNFASEKIDEDNIVDQNIDRGIIFMGDDTWTNLFPGKFKRQFPSPSLNVWDLDSVDKDVRYRIFFELKKKDWSLLIAHVLGIDHCGHKHGPNHPEMTRKLNDTNTLIQEIIESLEEDTILFVVGDHGMTQTGDHGGESLNEIEAAMFVYSLVPLQDYNSVHNTVNQIDLVPTLSSILGTPIPFSNLGSIVLDSLPSSSRKRNLQDDMWYSLHSVWRNIVQTKKYVDAYSTDTYLFSKEQFQNLEIIYNHLFEQMKHINTREEYELFIQNSKNYFKLLKDMCSEVWVQFDSSLMSKGLLLMFCTLFFFYLFITGIPESRMSKIFQSSYLQCSVLVNLITALIIFFLYFLDILSEFKNTTFFTTGLVSIVLLVILIAKNWDVISMKWYDYCKIKRFIYIIRVILLLTVCSLFSNSYIVEEDNVLSFLLVTLLWLLTFNLKQESFNEYSERKAKPFVKTCAKSNLKIVIIVIGLIACISVRLSHYFWRCREEQQQSMCSFFITGKMNSVTSNNLERVLLAVTLIVLALYVTIVRLWLQNCGNLTGFSPSVLVGQYCPVVIGVCMGCYWVLQRLPKFVKVKFALSWQVSTLPNIVYALSLIAISVLYYRPLSIFLLPKKKESINIYSDENIVPRLFEKIKESIYRKRIDADETPVVYGLGTAYSAAFISLSVFLMLLYSLLLGDVLSPSTFLMFLSCASVLGLSAIERYKNANSISELVEVPTSALVCWFLIAEYFFYGTGHQSTFSTIHWDAAFVGTGGHFYGNFIPAILIGINTFGSHIILGATLPLLVIVPFTLYLVFPKLVKAKFSEDDLKRGELLLFEQDSVFHTAVFSVAGKYVLLHGIRTFGIMLAATIHCRHLMVWKIFAPKLIFEGLGLLVTLSSVMASFYMVFRIDQRMEHLISKMTKGR